MPKSVTIAGAGLSGLTCAINLKKAGFEPYVFEAQKEIGWSKNGDWQGLENWTEEGDVLERLKTCGLTLNFRRYPFHEFTFYSYDREKFIYKSDKPLFYLVRRGNGAGDLDRSLKKQAEDMGITIKKGKAASLEQSDVLANGGQAPWAFGIGINFRTDLERASMTILDDRLAPKAYSYFLAIDGQATIVSAYLPRFRGKALYYLEQTIKAFKKIKDFDIEQEKKFSGVIHRGIKPLPGKTCIGEAGGFQDYLLGFGMYHAVASGYFGAQAIIEGNPPDQYFDKTLRPLVKTSKINRFVFERLGNRGYKIMLDRLSQKNKKFDFRKILKIAYTHQMSRFNALKRIIKYV